MVILQTYYNVYEQSQSDIDKGHSQRKQHWLFVQMPKTTT